MLSTRLLLASLGALLLAALVFALRPSLDVTAAALFFANSRFVGPGGLDDVIRRVFSTAPFVVMAVMALLYLARKAGFSRLWAPNAAGVLMMALSLALGPGLLVNGVLKEHSHRPRPYQLSQFGGSWEFRPFYRFDGACRRNCSFASGEGSTAFWTLAPALLTPAPVRPAAVAAALVFGVLTSALRMAYGGHFLSDTVLAALMSWLVIVLCWRLVAAVTRQAPGTLEPDAQPGMATHPANPRGGASR